MKSKILAFVILMAPHAAYADRQFVFAIVDQVGYLMHGCVGEPARATDQQKAAILSQPAREVQKSGIIGAKTPGRPVLEGYALDEEGHVVQLHSYLNVKVGSWEQGYSYVCGTADVAQAVSAMSGKAKTIENPSVLNNLEEFGRLKSAVEGVHMTTIFGQ